MGELEAENWRLRRRVTELEGEKARVEAFAAVAAHELLAPLVLADAYATTVSDQLDPRAHANARRDLEALRRAASRTRLLVETLLHDARAQDRPLRSRPLNLERVVSECLTLLSPELTARDVDVQVGELPGAHGEETLVSAVFTNLLLNALRHGPASGGVIRIDAALQPDACLCSVQSAGPTIPASDRDRIFGRFHRGRGQHRVPGTGLGLAICRQIVERHGGQIGVDIVGDGLNRFYFTLPAAAGAAPAANAEAPPRRRDAGSGAGSIPSGVGPAFASLALR
jgi:signal transduction histidine kinase